MDQQHDARLLAQATPATTLAYRRAETAADAPDNCYRCGYPLLGIADEQPCPECGLLARRSRRTTDELHDTRPRWLARISRGANLILLALVLAVGWWFAWRPAYGALYAYLPRASAMPYWLWNYGPMLGLGAGAVLLLIGAVLLASAEGYPPADRADRRLRLALRLSAAVPLVAMALVLVRGVLWSRAIRAGIMPPAAFGWWIRPLDAFTWAVSTLGCVPLPLLLFLQLRGLARRARSAHLAEHCLIVGLGTSATLLYVTAISYVFAHAREWGLGSDWVGRSNVALALVLVCAVAGVLFALWSVYLLVRFAIAFRRAARQMRGQWLADDRAITEPPPANGASPTL